VTPPIDVGKLAREAAGVIRRAFASNDYCYEAGSVLDDCVRAAIRDKFQPAIDTLTPPAPPVAETPREPERIAAAAVRQDGVVYTGAHHHQIIRYVFALTGRTVTGEQGFVTSGNRYVDREEAGRIALASRMVKALKFHERDLFSEELWTVADAAPLTRAEEAQPACGNPHPYDSRFEPCSRPLGHTVGHEWMAKRAPEPPPEAQSEPLPLGHRFIQHAGWVTEKCVHVLCIHPEAAHAPGATGEGKP
jgi:hypothetical protein